MVLLPRLNFPRLDPRASAATLSAPLGDAILPISGTTTITAITKGGRGQILILEFLSAACQVTNGGSGSGLQLNGNYLSSSGVKGTLTLECDDAGKWIEVARTPLGLAGLPTIPACRATHTTNQSLTSGTFTTLALATESFDTDNIHDTVTNNSRLTCKTAGKYQITGIIQYDPNATGTRVAAIMLNGGAFIGYTQAQAVATAGQGTVVTAATLYDLAVNDYVELQAYQNSGGALNASLANNYAPTLAMVRVG